MAFFFGAPEPQEDHGDHAVKAALAMLSRLQELNTQNGLVPTLTVAHRH